MLDMLQAASTILFLQEWTLASRSLAWLNLNNINRKPQEGHQKSDIRNPWDVNRMSTHHETSITWRGSLHHGHRGPAKVYGPRPQPNFWGWWIIVYPDEVFWMIRLPFATGVFLVAFRHGWKGPCRRVVAFPLQFHQGVAGSMNQGSAPSPPETRDVGHRWSCEAAASVVLLSLVALPQVAWSFSLRGVCG